MMCFSRKVQVKVCEKKIKAGLFKIFFNFLDQVILKRAFEVSNNGFIFIENKKGLYSV